jgi:hypothetical protein
LKSAFCGWKIPHPLSFLFIEGKKMKNASKKPATYADQISVLTVLSQRPPTDAMIDQMEIEWSLVQAAKNGQSPAEMARQESLASWGMEFKWLSFEQRISPEYEYHLTPPNRPVRRVRRVPATTVFHGGFDPDFGLWHLDHDDWDDYYDGRYDDLYDDRRYDEPPPEPRSPYQHFLDKEDVFDGYMGFDPWDFQFEQEERLMRELHLFGLKSAERRAVLREYAVR